MSDKIRAYLYLHICVFLWGFTAILGKLISLQALPLVWWRVFISSVALWIILPKASIRNITRQQFWQLFMIGIIVGFHWLCFYGAVKLANASVAVAAMATAPFFSSLTEPFVLKQRVKKYEFVLGILILPGMALLIGTIDLSYKLGFAVGIFGAFLAAYFTALNKKVLDQENPPPPLAISFVELFGAWAVSTIALPFAWASQTEFVFWLEGMDWPWMMVMALLCTVWTYYLSLLAMRHLTAFATNLTINLEPVYGVLLAMAIFQEHRELSPGFYFGVVIILLAVFSHPFLKWYVEKRQAAHGAVS